jgi:hypothetical protein
LLSFSSSLFGEYGDQRTVVIVYAAHVGLAELSLQWVWRYVSRDPRLVDTSLVDERDFRYGELEAGTHE